jgi:IS5 family transposase
LPCHPTSLVKWRHRVKAEGIEKLLQEIVASAQRAGALKAKDLERVNVDTTVQEKAIAFPTDARLYEKARVAVVRQAQKDSIKLRQSYQRLALQHPRAGGRMHCQRQSAQEIRIWLQNRDCDDLEE